MTATVSKTKNTPGKESCGNAGAVESVESQKPASPSFHSPLGISPRTGEIPTFPQLRRKQADGKVENQKQVSHFPTATNPFLPEGNRGRGAGFALRPAAGASRALRVKE
jgi:hypothetical protein